MGVPYDPAASDERHSHSNANDVAGAVAHLPPEIRAVYKAAVSPNDADHGAVPKVDLQYGRSEAKRGKS